MIPAIFVNALIVAIGGIYIISLTTRILILEDENKELKEQLMKCEEK